MYIYIYTGKVKLLKNPSSKVGSNSTNHGAMVIEKITIKWFGFMIGFNWCGF